MDSGKPESVSPILMIAKMGDTLKAMVSMDNDIVDENGDSILGNILLDLSRRHPKLASIICNIAGILERENNGWMSAIPFINPKNKS